MIHILRLLSSLFSQLFGNETEVITMRNHTNVGYLRKTLATKSRFVFQCCKWSIVASF